MDKPIRVAQIIGITKNGGVGSVIMNYYEHIDRSKVQFDFFVESEDDLIYKEKVEALGGKIIIIPSYKNLRLYIKTLIKLFKEGDYDIVHSNMNTLSVFSLYAAKKAEIKVRIAHSHSTSNPKEWKKNILKNLLRPWSKKFATHYFACSELAGRYLFGNKTFNEGKVLVVNNGVDYKKFEYNATYRKQIRDKYGIDDKTYLIGTVGRFVEQKNHLFLLKTFRKYYDSDCNTKLMLVGDGPLLNKYKNFILNNKLDDCVIIAGTQKNVELYYSAFDLFVLPSLYEGLPVVGVEAQVNGVPCIFSSNVTDEVKINNNVLFLHIEEQQYLKAYKDNKNRLCELNYKFDIKCCANHLLIEYIRILDKQRN